jgi:polyisoprenoid-binding protein YceI
MTDHHTAATLLPLQRGLWTLDEAHSSVLFSVRHLGLSKVRGRFEHFDATMSIGTTLDDVYVDATIHMASVNTNNPDRDAHLRSTDFFAVEANPTTRFTSRRIVPDRSHYTMHGDLTINETTRAIALPVEFNGTEAFQDQRHAGFSAEGELRRSDYGIDFGIHPIGADRLALADIVKFELDLQFVEPTTNGDA